MQIVKWILAAIPIFLSSLFITFLFFYFVADFNPQFKPQIVYVLWLLPPLVLAWGGFSFLKRFIENNVTRYFVTLIGPWVWILGFAVLIQYVVPVLG